MQHAVLLFAHAGHWTTQLIYLAPVGALGGALLVSWWKERRRTPTSKENSK